MFSLILGTLVAVVVVMRAHDPLARLRTVAILSVLAVAGPLAAPSPLTGQGSCTSMSECAPLRPALGLDREAQRLAVNALLGGGTAAVTQMAKGGSVWDAFWTGALGGATSYAGKRVAVEEFAGAGFLGRQITSVGASFVRNGVAGRALLEEAVLPLGPVRLYVSKTAGVQPRLDVATLMAGAAFVLAYDARLDPAASLSAGALVFRGSGPMPGLSSAGAMMVWREIPELEEPRLLAHERVHMLQYDQAFLSWADPVERWIVGRSGADPAIFRHFDFGGLVLGARAGLSLALDYSDRPWEREAYFMAELGHPIHAH